MSLATPTAIRSLQRKLYRKAKAEPAFRFYLLHDKIYREDILRHAYALACANAGGPGRDGMTFAAIETLGLENWLAGLREELISKTYRPDPVRRLMIPKPDGGERPLGIPTIRDRVVQAAAKLVLEPIFEADFEDNAYGYRPARGAVDAVKEVHRHVCRGYTDVVDADLSRYFDSIPHDELLKSVARRIEDRHVLRLIKLWLKAPIEERDDDGTRRIGGGKRNARGTPQGGVVSPMLANIYMNRFLKYWRLTGRGEAFRAHVVAYADDFVILSRGRAAEALAWTTVVMTRLGLAINEVKTSLKNARQERFDFLGYSFGPHRYKANGLWYLSASPSKKSVHRLKTKVGNLLVPGTPIRGPKYATR
jgi:RNA-directed DNA polymerase